MAGKTMAHGGQVGQVIAEKLAQVQGSGKVGDQEERPALIVFARGHPLRTADAGPAQCRQGSCFTNGV